jgi:hypothetical protein
MKDRMKYSKIYILHSKVRLKQGIIGISTCLLGKSLGRISLDVFLTV